MPAALPAASVKKDIRLYTDDVTFLEALLATPGRNSNLNEYVRNLVHRAANAERKRLGLEQTPPT